MAAPQPDPPVDAPYRHPPVDAPEPDPPEDGAPTGRVARGRDGCDRLSTAPIGPQPLRVVPTPNGQAARWAGRAPRPRLELARSRRAQGASDGGRAGGDGRPRRRERGAGAGPAAAAPDPDGHDLPADEHVRRPHLACRG